MTLFTTKVGSWKLDDLVKDPNGKEFQEFLESISTKVSQLEIRRKNLHDKVSTVEFEDFLHSIEEISEKINIAAGFAHLSYTANTSSNEFAALVTKMGIFGSNIANRLLFFDLWFKKGVGEETAQRLIGSVSPVYREYLKHQRLLAKYTLTEPEEKIITTLEVTGTSALIKIYDRMTSGFEFVLTLKRGRRSITRTFTNKEKLLTLIRSTIAEEREAAYNSLLQVYKKNSGVLGEIYQNRVIEWRDEHMTMRGYRSPISVRNTHNDLDDTTVETLLAVCRRNSIVFQDYFKQKAKMLGVKKLLRYHLYAPLSIKASDQKRFTYGKATDTVLKTFEHFHPKFREFAEKVFNEQHVDSEIRKSKLGGAFCSSISPKMTPYVLLNFDGKSRDVSTMAHEFGHAIHSMTASDKPITVWDAPLPLAETASVFAEMLLNDKLSERITKVERRILLAEQIDDMYATIMRQAYFTLFEIDAHRAVAEKNATIDMVSELYLKNLNEQFGNSVNVTRDFQWEWLYIPHFYHTPFYCYAYSFGNLLVLSLYQQFKSEGKSFIPKYFKILSAGGSQKPEYLLKESGIDISKDEFWQQGFDLVAAKIQELKEMN
ncbi:MAG TPA: M3 family oligoendopeptidase [Candidatus Nitrosopolaris sp.]|nr:M3 family oligoendopeptidase [Candidatus Nitrosopolaris sp.]